MYHGTSIANARLIIPNGFEQSSDGLMGNGVYVTRDILKACNYPKNSKLSDRVVLKLRVCLGKCKVICKDDDPLLTTWHKEGYDSAWVPPDCNMTAVPSGLQENCVFEPERVEVVGIARAQPPAVEKELLTLLEKNGKRQEGHGDTNVCLMCSRKTHWGIPHILQRCWTCNKNICILMIEHKCRVN